MIKVIVVPISVPVHPMDFEEEIAKRTKHQAKLEAEALEALDNALSTGFEIRDSRDIQVNGMTCIRYTLHKFELVMNHPEEAAQSISMAPQGAVIFWNEGEFWEILEVNPSSSGDLFSCRNLSTGQVTQFRPEQIANAKVLR